MKSSQPYKYEPVFLNSKTGDKVWSSEYGEGIIHEISPFIRFPVIVQFTVKNGRTHQSYTFDGLRTDDSMYPTLFLKKKRTNFPLYLPPPPDFPVDTFMYVSRDGKNWYRRYFCKWLTATRGGVTRHILVVWCDGRTSKTASQYEYVEYVYYKLESGETNYVGKSK